MALASFKINQCKLLSVQANILGLSLVYVMFRINLIFPIRKYNDVLYISQYGNIRLITEMVPICCASQDKHLGVGDQKKTRPVPQADVWGMS